MDGISFWFKKQKRSYCFILKTKTELFKSFVSDIKFPAGKMKAHFPDEGYDLSDNFRVVIRWDNRTIGVWRASEESQDSTSMLARSYQSQLLG